MSGIECWRCSSLVESGSENCPACGVASPGSKRLKSGGPNQEVLDAYLKRSAPGVSGGASSPKISLTSTASRLRKESGVAIRALNIWAATLIALIAIAAIVSLFAPGDFLSHIVILLAAAVLIGFTYVSLMFVLPFYTYMNLRAQELQNRENN